MKKILFSALTAAAFLTSCSQSNKNEYVIYGTVSDPKLEGAQVFLVPIDNPVKEEIDSVYIEDQVFEFRGTKERMADIRIEKFKRFGNQTLLVVTEPGVTYATIGKISSGRGTPQNDSLQVWKNLTTKHYQQLQRTPKEKVDELKAAYVARSLEIASNVGENSTLGKFLNSRFPEDVE